MPDSTRNPMWNDQDYERILKQATEVFGDADQAKSWLREPAYGLGNRRPRDVENVGDVTDCLGRMEYGVYA